jgi:hypothetical protein
VSLGLAGIGLPESDYMAVARALYSKDDSVICPSSHGGFCHSEKRCAELNIKDDELNV